LSPGDSVVISPNSMGEIVNRIYCRVCGRPNEVQAETCAGCGHSLYVVCHCGTRNVRSHASCVHCGDLLRRRRADPEPSVFSFSGSPSSLGTSTGSNQNDLTVAVLAFLAVALIFGGVWFGPWIAAYGDEMIATLDGSQQQSQSTRDSNNQRLLELIARRNAEHAKQQNPLEAWIKQPWR